MDQRSQTHWTRIFYRNLFEPEESAPRRTPVASALVLLAMYVALSLAIAAVVRLLDAGSEDARTAGGALVSAAVAPSEVVGLDDATRLRVTSNSDLLP